MFHLLPYAYSISLAIFRLKFLHNTTVEGTLIAEQKISQLSCHLFFKLLGNTSELFYTMILQVNAKQLPWL